MTDYRAELQRLVQAYDEHGGRWPDEDVQALHNAVKAARTALAQPAPPARLRHCDVHGQQPANAWGCPECVREMRQQLAQPEPKGPTDQEIDEWQSHCAYLTRSADNGGAGTSDHYWAFDVESDHVASIVRAALARWGRPTIEPVSVAERFEFSVFNSEYEEQAGGTAPTYAEALGYGQHYLSQYSQDGPHSLEIRRVEVLPHHAMPIPTP
jgi:hypothetical protein